MKLKTNTGVSRPAEKKGMVFGSLSESVLYFGFFVLVVAGPLIGRPGFLDRILQKGAFFFLGVSLLAVCWLLFSRGRPILIDDRFYLLLIFLLTVTISTWFSFQRVVSLWGSYGHWEGAPAFFIMGATYFLALQVDWDRRRVKNILWVLTVVAAGLAFSALVKFGLKLAGPGGITGADRAKSLLVGPNMFSFYLMMIFPVSLRLFLWSETKKWAKVVSAFATLFILAANIITLSRTGMIVSIVMALIVVLLSNKKKQALAALIVLFIALSAVAGLAAGRNSFKQFALARFGSIFNPAVVVQRTSMWESALKLTWDRPLTGYGPDTFSIVQVKHESARLAAFDAKPRSPHNYFLDISAGLGIPALILLLIFFFKTLHAALTGPDYLKKTLGFSLISMLLSSQLLIWHIFLIMPFWLFMGMTSRGKFRLSDRKGISLKVGLAVTAVAVMGLTGRVLVADHYFYAHLAANNKPARIARLRQAVAVNPYVDVYWRIWFKRSNNSKNPRPIGETIEVVEGAKKFLPAREEPLIMEAKLKRRQGVDAHRVLDLLDRALAIRPLSVEAHILKGKVLLDTKNYVEAEKEFDQVLAVKPDKYKYIREALEAKASIRTLKP